MNFEISTPLTVTYSVDKCIHEQFNGEHTEEFDLSKLTSEDFTQYLAQCLVIKRQSQLRSKATINEAGETKLVVGTWIVPAPGKRISTTPVEKAAALMAKLTEEQKRQIAESMGFTYIPKGLAALQPDNTELAEHE